jgi:hypothetical protein
MFLPPTRRGMLAAGGRDRGKRQKGECAHRASTRQGMVYSASFEKRVGGNGRSSPSSASNARWNGCRGAGPCQALAAEGGGRKARLYKGQASPATIATGAPTGCSSRPCAGAKPLAGRYITIRNSKELYSARHSEKALDSLSGECPQRVCAVTRRRFPVGARPTRRFAPAGSNRSRHGGDDMSEAFG